MIKNIRIEDNRCTFDITNSDIEFANALRRSLISDIITFAPDNVTFEINTSCQTDEYIAHRIGLIPFTIQMDEEEEDLSTETLTFDVENRIFTTNDLCGKFQTIYTTDIMKLINNQKLKGKVSFTKGCGGDHAKFSPVAAAGYEIKDKNTISFSFESINGESPIKHLKFCLRKLQSRLENVKYQIESASS